MEDRSHALIAIIFLAVLTAGAAGIAFWMQSGRAETEPYLIISPYSVSGLKPQAPVNFQGIQVGTVQSVELAPKDRDKVRIRISVTEQTPVTEATYAQISSNGITGVSSVTLAQSKNGAPPLQTSQEHPATIPMQRGLLQSLEHSGKQVMKQAKDVMRHADDMMRQVDDISQRAQKLLNDDNRAHVSAILQHLDGATQKLVDLENQMSPVLESLPALLDSARKTLEQSQALLAQARRSTATFDEVLKHTDDLTQTLSNSTLPRVDALTEQLDNTLENIDKLTRILQQNPQRVIFGSEQAPPGPGEPGYVPPSRQQERR